MSNHENYISYLLFPTILTHKKFISINLRRPRVVPLHHISLILPRTKKNLLTDKWKHCIHVFSKDNEYLRSMCHKGSRAGMLRSPEGIATDNAQLLLYVVDTGNDRVQVTTVNIFVCICIKQQLYFEANSTLFFFVNLISFSIQI